MGAQVDIRCPNCKRVFYVHLKAVSPGKVLSCHHCRTDIPVDSRLTFRVIKGIERELGRPALERKTSHSFD